MGEPTRAMMMKMKIVLALVVICALTVDIVSAKPKPRRRRKRTAKPAQESAATAGDNAKSCYLMQYSSCAKLAPILDELPKMAPKGIKTYWRGPKENFMKWQTSASMDMGKGPLCRSTEENDLIIVVKNGRFLYNMLSSEVDVRHEPAFRKLVRQAFKLADKCRKEFLPNWDWPNMNKKPLDPPKGYLKKRRPPKKKAKRGCDVMKVPECAELRVKLDKCVDTAQRGTKVHWKELVAYFIKFKEMGGQYCKSKMAKRQHKAAQYIRYIYNRVSAEVDVKYGAKFKGLVRATFKQADKCRRAFMPSYDWERMNDVEV